MKQIFKTSKEVTTLLLTLFYLMLAVAGICWLAGFLTSFTNFSIVVCSYLSITVIKSVCKDFYNRIWDSIEKKDKIDSEPKK